MKASAASARPVLPSEISQYFIPLRNEVQRATLVYHPAVFGAAQVRFTDKTIDTTKDLSVVAPIGDGVVAIDWNQATVVDLPLEDLDQTPQDGAQFADLPSPGSKAKSYDTWKKDFSSWLYRTQKIELLQSAALGQTSNADESERDFRVRLQQFAREARDAAAEKLRQKYAPKIAALEERKRRAEQAVDREAEQAKSQKMQTAISFGTTLLSSFLGRKSLSLTTLGRATTAARGVGRSMKESEDVGRAQETVEAVNQMAANLDAEFKTEKDALENSFDAQTEPLETVTLKPTKTNIAVKVFSLAWAPYWHDAQGQATPGWQ
jgi:hypothetical protein